MPRSTADLGPGDHLCCLYETEEEHRAVLTPFLRQGLERGEKVLYIVDARTAEAIIGNLRDEGLDAESYLARGQLMILTADEAYLKQGMFDPDGMIALLQTETAAALAEGYAALRVTGEMSWALRGLPGSERLIEYEARLNEFFPGSKCLAICQYDRRAFPPQLLLDVLCTHPTAVVGTEVCDNFYYIPPTEFLGDDPLGAQLRNWVENLANHKRVERALQESEQRFRGLYESMRDGVVRTDMEGKIIAANRAYLDMLGYTWEEVTGLTYQQLTPEDWHEMEAEIVENQVLKAGYSDEYEKEYVRKDGTTFPISVRVWLVRDEQGEAQGMWGIVRDISERRQAEEALERLRSEFTGMVTHELKTPLTAIKGSAATALGSSRPRSAEQSRELFQIINEQADRLRDLVDDLLDMTRIEAGSLSVIPGPIDLRPILEAAVDTLVRGGGAQPVELELPDGLPAVNADGHRILQVLTNLLSNASKSSPATEPITIVVEYDRTQVTVHVQDRGRGIPKEKLPLLFKKFSRLHDDGGQKLSGTGLGLAICKGIVEAHGGRIWAESAGVGRGSTFSFTLPMANGASVEALTGEARRAVHLQCKHPVRVRRPGERTRVLAVDDEPQVLRYLQRSLDEAGYQPIVTTDPSQVTNLLELEEPDVILLDLKLPGTSGFELLQRIREFSGVPVIFLTASDREEDAVRALKMGADDYITKPFSPAELFARIGAVLRRRLLADVTEVRPPFALRDLTIDFAERRVTVGDREVSLSATEYKVLYQLATHAGRVLTHDQILRHAWGEEYSGETELVRSLIRHLRRKLGDDAQRPQIILTERQVGYRMPKP